MNVVQEKTFNGAEDLNDFCCDIDCMLAWEVSPERKEVFHVLELRLTAELKAVERAFRDRIEILLGVSIVSFHLASPPSWHLAIHAATFYVPTCHCRSLLHFFTEACEGFFAFFRSRLRTLRLVPLSHIMSLILTKTQSPMLLTVIIPQSRLFSFASSISTRLLSSCQIARIAKLHPTWSNKYTWLCPYYKIPAS